MCKNYNKMSQLSMSRQKNFWIISITLKVWIFPPKNRQSCKCKLVKILARKFKCTLISLKGIMKINRVILIFLARKSSKLWNFWNFSSNNLKLTRLGTSASKFFWNFYQLKNREYKGSNNVNFQVLAVISDFFLSSWKNFTPQIIG